MLRERREWKGTERSRGEQQKMYVCMKRWRQEKNGRRGTARRIINRKTEGSKGQDAKFWPRPPKKAVKMKERWCFLAEYYEKTDATFMCQGFVQKLQNPLNSTSQAHWLTHCIIVWVVVGLWAVWDFESFFIFHEVARKSLRPAMK